MPGEGRMEPNCGTELWLQLHVSLVYVSACSFAVSQASDLALLVGYVA